MGCLTKFDQDSKTSRRIVPVESSRPTVQTLFESGQTISSLPVGAPAGHLMMMMSLWWWWYERIMIRWDKRAREFGAAKCEGGANSPGHNLTSYNSYILVIYSHVIIIISSFHHPHIAIPPFPFNQLAHDDHDKPLPRLQFCPMDPQWHQKAEEEEEEEEEWEEGGSCNRVGTVIASKRGQWNRLASSKLR